MGNILIEAGGREILERDAKGLTLLHHILLEGVSLLHASTVHLLVVWEVGRLHRLEHEFLVLAHLIVRHVLVLTVEEDPRGVLETEVG